MSAIVSLSLAPFELLFRHTRAHPWLAMGISFLVAIGAYLTGHDVWACLLVAFGSYVMMWLGEQGRPAEQGTHEEQV